MKPLPAITGLILTVWAGAVLADEAASVAVETVASRTRVAVPAGSVISGAAFRAEIIVGELSGWIVPHDAVRTDAKGSYVVQLAGTTASRVNVTVAGPDGGDDVVRGPLDPQRPVVMQGNP